MSYEITYAASVPYGDSFLLVGGEMCGGDYSDRIVQYEPVSETFAELDSRLSRPKSSVTAMLVNKSIFPEC